MVDHIYGKINLISRNDRPHMFIKELQLYLSYLRGKIEESSEKLNDSQIKYFNTFSENLEQGIEYYHALFSNFKEKFANIQSDIFQQLSELKDELDEVMSQVKPEPARVLVR
jgi:hypothetical protein